MVYLVNACCTNLKPDFHYQHSCEKTGCYGSCLSQHWGGGDRSTLRACQPASPAKLVGSRFSETLFQKQGEGLELRE